jgi:hypothetical protein
MKPQISRWITAAGIVVAAIGFNSRGEEFLPSIPPATQWLYWTNTFRLKVPDAAAPTAEARTDTTPAITILSFDEVPTGTAEADEISLFSNLTAHAIYDWQFNNGTTNRAGESSGIQIVEIDPLEADAGAVTIPEGPIHFAEPPVEWYQWLHPRMFLVTWADFWMHETNTTPVVIFSIRF